MPPRSETYLHGHHESVLRSHQWRTAENSAAYLLPLLTPGAHVLDVGCGPGTITVDLAALVPDGHVTGIDAAEGVLDNARQEAGQRGQGNVTFETGNVYQLSYPDDSFDVVHAHQVLQHLSDPVAALAEMRRVCRPGGLVAARDGDYGAMFWYPAEPGMTEWQALYRSVAREIGGEPDAGRHMLAWARAAGLRGHRGLGQRVVLRRAGRPAVVGRAVGAAADRIAVRRPGRRAGPGHSRRPGAAGPGLAALGARTGTAGSPSRTARFSAGPRLSPRGPG